MLGLENMINGQEGAVPQTPGTKLAKIENNEFIGFYDKEIHSELVFQEQVVLPNLEEGNPLPQKVLKPEYVEITDVFWQELLDGQSNGKEIRFLKTNVLGLYEKPICTLKGFKVEFNYETEVWEEKGTLEEQVDWLDSEMLRVDLLILDKEKELHSRNRRGIIPPTVQEELNALRLELDEIVIRHMEISHELALSVNKVLKDS